MSLGCPHQCFSPATNPQAIERCECHSGVAPGARLLLTRWFDLGGGGDAGCGGVVVEVVEGGEGVWGGLDVVAGLVQEPAEAGGGAADEVAADAEQGGGGAAGQAVAVAQDEGQERAGKGQAVGDLGSAPQSERRECRSGVAGATPE